MLSWILEYHVFAYDTYVKNSESVTETQRLFHRRFKIGCHGNVPNHPALPKLLEHQEMWIKWEKQSPKALCNLLGNTLRNWE